MNHTLQKLILALSIGVLGAGTSPCFAQSAGEPTAPVPANERAQAPKNPVPMTIQEDKRTDELRIVSREKAANSNMANVVAGIAQAKQGVLLYADSGASTKFYGDTITDAPNRRNLMNPLLGDFQKALDQKIVDLLVNDGSSAAVYNNPITLAPLGWHLVYHDLGTPTVQEDEYVLRFAVDIGKIAEGKEDNFVRRANRPGRSCQYVSQPRALAVWKSNEYAAVAVEQKLAIQACIDSLTPLLSEFLGIDYHTKVRNAKINCKSKWVKCNEAAEKTENPMPGYKVCRAEFNQCGNHDMESLVAATPIGKCKVTYAACKRAIIDTARALNPGATPERIEFNPCWIEHNACVEATK